MQKTVYITKYVIKQKKPTRGTCTLQIKLHMNKSVDSPLLYAYNLGYLSRSSNPLPLIFWILERYNF